MSGLADKTFDGGVILLPAATRESTLAAAARMRIVGAISTPPCPPHLSSPKFHNKDALLLLSLLAYNLALPLRTELDTDTAGD